MENILTLRLDRPLDPLTNRQDLLTASTLSLCAGVCSALGATFAITLVGSNMPLQQLASSQAALGAALLFLGCCDLLPEAAAGISLLRAAIFFALGALCSAAAARLMRHRIVAALVSFQGGEDIPPLLRLANVGGEGVQSGQRISLRAEVLVVGLVTFVSLSLHNLLEGMSILFAVQEGLERGVRLAAAISLENIPEGVCIALPLYFATGRKSIAIRLALVSGLMEVVGVLLPGLFFGRVLNQTSISSVLAIIAGILVFVALAEMLPLAVKTSGTRMMGSLSLWMGCGVLTATMFQPLLMYHARIGRVQ